MGKLREVVKGIMERYDFILLDTATGISQESLIPVMICDEGILIVNAEFPSVVDTQKMRLIAENMDKRVRGVVINRVSGIKRELGAKKLWGNCSSWIFRVFFQMIKIWLAQ